LSIDWIDEVFPEEVSEILYLKNDYEDDNPRSDEYEDEDDDDNLEEDEANV